VNMLVVLLIS